MKEIKEYIWIVKWILGREFKAVLDKGFTDDLFQQGMVGLVVAAAKFDETRGVKFATFAVIFVRRFIIQGVKACYKNKEVSLTTELTLEWKSGIEEATKYAEKLRNLKKVEELISLLDGTIRKRDILILKRRFGIGDNKPRKYKEIAKEFGLSIGRGRQIVKSLLQFLRTVNK